MANKISIRSVQLDWLDSRCLIKISKYARRRFDVDTQIMDLRDPNILRQVIDHAHETDDAQLQSIYLALKEDIKTCLADKTNLDKVLPETIPDYLIADLTDSKIPRKEILKRWFNSHIKIAT